MLCLPGFVRRFFFLIITRAPKSVPQIGLRLACCILMPMFQLSSFKSRIMSRRFYNQDQLFNRPLGHLKSPVKISYESKLQDNLNNNVLAGVLPLQDPPAFYTLNTTPCPCQPHPSVQVSHLHYIPSPSHYPKVFKTLTPFFLLFFNIKAKTASLFVA